MISFMMTTAYILCIFLLSLKKTSGGLFGENSCGGGDCDTVAFNALSELHAQLDDDHDGGVDPSEADEFVRDELHYTDGFERTQNLHGTDKHISKEELWASWRHSEVYNWTVNDVVNWLVQDVELPKYAESFVENTVDGTILPRLATKDQSFLTGTLKIKNSVHRRKIQLKAMDAVLFGPPNKGRHGLKDFALLVSMVLGLGGCWFALVQRRFSQRHVTRLKSELDGLSRAEKSLIEMQARLEQAEKKKEAVHEEKRELEKKFKSHLESTKTEAGRLSEERSRSRADSDRLRLAEEEVSCLRSLLEEGGWAPPPGLQTLLRTTYDMEVQYYTAKKTAVEMQMTQAKESCDKLRRKRGAFMGSLRIAHSSTLDEMETKISVAGEAMEDLRRAVEERRQRWFQIEEMTGLRITGTSSQGPLSRAMDSHQSLATLLTNQSSLGSESRDSINLDDAVFSNVSVKDGKQTPTDGHGSNEKEGPMKQFGLCTQRSGPPRVSGILQPSTGRHSHGEYNGATSNNSLPTHLENDVHMRGRDPKDTTLKQGPHTSYSPEAEGTDLNSTQSAYRSVSGESFSTANWTEGVGDGGQGDPTSPSSNTEDNVTVKNAQKSKPRIPRLITSKKS